MDNLISIREESNYQYESALEPPTQNRGSQENSIASNFVKRQGIQKTHINNEIKKKTATHATRKKNEPR